MNRMVCGFIFHESMNSVLLARMGANHKIEYIAGKLNGCGGKIEPGESAQEAMQRECFEEVFFNSYPTDWKNIITIRGEDYEVDFYFMVLNSFHCECLSKRLKEEGVDAAWYHVKALPDDVVFNLRWLIPLAADPDIYKPLGGWEQPWTNAKAGRLVTGYPQIPES